MSTRGSLGIENFRATTRLRPDTSALRLARPASCPLASSYRHPRLQTAALHPRFCTVGPFPFIAKSPCTSHPSSYGRNTSIAHIASTDLRTSKAQVTAAIRSARRSLPLAIAPRGLDLVAIRKGLGWIWICSGLRTFLLSPLDSAVLLSILHPPILF